MYTFITTLVVFLTAWNSVNGFMHQCLRSFNSVPSDARHIDCQVGIGRHFSCEIDNCWVSESPARGDTKYNILDHITFKNCHKYKAEFGNSKQEKSEVSVQAVAYWGFDWKDHLNVIGHEVGKEPPKNQPLPGYRCYDLESPLAQCRSDNCKLVEKPKDQ
ncbi:uncharacterized protein MELLADRAFT_124289 [Melampsora larici-populina 98AG31]|uniref:Secreted protein n=1 Tax=Melampsora larici-populina (strain 98AG31 / pathotype 3-4-7) TaxID=747676 RepID=F4RMV4_MELLP|nr:uncharacterized protein MELLADRAFT_124289 [Melampsora larici-populina 98AG31]EGG06179.1 secreted protein [Melampsora larici-populina 98AG31]